MKRIILPFIFALFSISGFSQAKLQVSYADFQAWAKQVKIAGYPFIESEQDGADYSTMFGSGPTKAFQLRALDIKRFGEYKMTNKEAAVYTLNGYKAVYFNFGGATMLAIELPQAQLALTYAMSGKVAKATMEDLALKSNLQSLKTSSFTANTTGVKWPEVIPADLRLAGVESIESQGSDGTYKDVIEVKVKMSPTLVTSVEAILKKYNGELSLTQTPKVDFLCGAAESIGQLKADIKNGESVTFMYYIK
jgi:hypothetical protein